MVRIGQQQKIWSLQEVPVEVEYKEEFTEDREVDEDMVQEIRLPQVKALCKCKGEVLRRKR